ncbi:MAG: SRPBCC family protein [Actinobacteria bacterium]|nr:SRPBCC family protein [Actinomycetota bacterium]
MANYRTTVTSPASAETAYRYLADFASIIDWDPSVSEAALVSGEPGELGARYRVVVSIPLRTIPLEYEIVEASPPTSANSPAKVALRAQNADVDSYDVITFEPRTDGGTDVTYDAQLTGRGFRRVFDPFFGVVMQLIGQRARSGLMDALGALPAARP